MGRDSPPMYPMSDAGRGSSRQELLYTTPGMFLPPPSTVSSLTSDVHVWSPLSLHHPSFSSRSSQPTGAYPSGPWSSALLSAYMMHLLPHHHHHPGHATRVPPDSPHHSPPHKPLPLVPDQQFFIRSQSVAENGTCVPAASRALSPASPPRYQVSADLRHRLPNTDADVTDGDSD